MNKNPAVRWKPARLPNQPCNHWQSGDVELVIVYFRASLSFLPNHCNQAIMLGTYMIGGACSCEWKPVKDVACSLALFLQWFVQLLVFSDYLFFVCAWTCMYWIYISINIWKCFDLVGSEKKKIVLNVLVLQYRKKYSALNSWLVSITVERSGSLVGRVTL